jgi:Cu2+-containing amine oxidase
VRAQEFAAMGSFIQYGGVVDHALVIRGIATVYNTDYITDVTLHLNGAIEARASALATQGSHAHAAEQGTMHMRQCPAAHLACGAQCACSHVYAA